MKVDDNLRDSIFSLLYAVVLIDNRVVKIEVDLFLARIEGYLTTTNLIGTLKAKSIISTWFVQNYKQIKREMKSPNRQDFLFGLVDDLKFYSNRQEVFDIMMEIAIADDEFHAEEKTFLDEVSKIWGLKE